MGKMASRRPLLLRFNVGLRRDRGHAGLLSHLRVVIGRLGSRPRSEQTSHPVHTHGLANTRWFPAGRHVFTLRKPRTVSSGSYLFPEISTDSTAFGFCLGVCLPAFRSTRQLNVYADHAGGLWVLGRHDIVRLKDGVVTSHFELQGTMFQSISEDPDGSLWVAQNAAGRRPFATLPSARSSVSERLMEYRFPRSILLLGRRERRLLAGRADGPCPLARRPLGDVPGRSVKAMEPGFRAWRVVPMGLYGWAYSEKVQARTCTIEGWCYKTVRDPHLRRKQGHRHEHDVRP